MDDTLSTIASLLVQSQVFSKEVARTHQQAALAQSSRLLTYLAIDAHICPKIMAHSLAAHFGLNNIDLDTVDIDALPIHLIPTAMLRQYHVVPLACHANQLYLAVDDPSQQNVFKEIQFLTACQIIPMVAQTTQLTLMIDALLRETDHRGLTHYLHTQASNKSLSVHQQALSLLLPHNSNDEAPIVAFVQRILDQAISRGASDVHFECYDHHYRIRYRQDGLLHELATPPFEVAGRIAARLKVMADLDISERRLPQDGRFSLLHKHHYSVECRFNSCPMIDGEKIVIRILNHELAPLDMDHLGLSVRDKCCFLQSLARPQGLVLVTGPTGSGKTVTLYAALNHLNTGDKNISSAEDPVEIKQVGINQVQINPKQGLTFSTVLRAFLRQDPDVIMVGEIRDYDTADMAIKAAHTGHLVLSTLHTNSSAETIIRLQQIGIPSFLLTSTLHLIITQRLLRRLCPYCKIAPSDGSQNSGYRAKGCHRCHNGYRGRVAIFEVMPISSPLRQLMMMADVTADQLAIQAQKEGMLSLHQAGLEHLKNGVTSFEEIQRVI